MDLLLNYSLPEWSGPWVSRESLWGWDWNKATRGYRGFRGGRSVGSTGYGNRRGQGRLLQVSCWRSGDETGVLDFGGQREKRDCAVHLGFSVDMH